MNNEEKKVNIKRKLSGRISLLPKPHVHHVSPKVHIGEKPKIVPHLSTIQMLSCGFLAGCFTRTVVAPLDVIKIMVQLRGINGYCANKGIFETLARVYQSEGFRGFWKGNFAGCSRLAPYTATKFLVYDTAKEHFAEDGEHLCNRERLMFGGIAGMVATMTSYPMELVRTRMIVQHPNDRQLKGVVHGIKVILNSHGILGLYRGSTSAVIGVMPFEGIQFMCYESLKDYVQRVRLQHEDCCDTKDQITLHSMDYLLLGSVSGLVAQTIAYPLDTIKKRIQAQCNHLYKNKPIGMVECTRMIWRQDGIYGFYQGIYCNMIRILPYSAVMFASYEFFKNIALQHA